MIGLKNIYVHILLHKILVSRPRATARDHQIPSHQMVQLLQKLPKEWLKIWTSNSAENEKACFHYKYIQFVKFYCESTLHLFHRCLFFQREAARFLEEQSSTEFKQTQRVLPNLQFLSTLGDIHVVSLQMLLQISCPCLFDVQLVLSDKVFSTFFHQCCRYKSNTMLPIIDKEWNFEKQLDLDFCLSYIQYLQATKAQFDASCIEAKHHNAL